MAQYEAIKAANAAYVAAFSPEKRDLAMPPARKAAVVICMVRARDVTLRYARAARSRAARDGRHIVGTRALTVGPSCRRRTPASSPAPLWDSRRGAWQQGIARERSSGESRRRAARTALTRVAPFRPIPLADPRSDMHVIRNAGGRAAEAVRSLAISQQLLGTREVRVAVALPFGVLPHAT